MAYGLPFFDLQKKTEQLVWRTQLQSRTGIQKIWNSKIQELSKIANSYFHDVPHNFSASGMGWGNHQIVSEGGAFPGGVGKTAMRKCLMFANPKQIVHSNNFQSPSRLKTQLHQSYQLPSSILICDPRKIEQVYIISMDVPMCKN